MLLTRCAPHLEIAFCQSFEYGQGFFYSFYGYAVGDAEVAGAAEVVAGYQHEVHFHGAFAECYGIGFQGAGEHIEGSAGFYAVESVFG